MAPLIPFFFFPLYFSSFFFFLFLFIFFLFSLSFFSFSSFLLLSSSIFLFFFLLSSFFFLLSSFFFLSSFFLLSLSALSVKQRILVETDHGRKSVTARMDDSDASPISESEVLEGSVASAVASGSAAPEFTRLPECETMAADEPDGYWQRRRKCSARRRIRQYYMTGTTTWKRNTITDERALDGFFDPQVIFQVQTKLHIHRSWRIPAKISKEEPMEQTQVTELSITSWNPDTLNHGKLESLLTYFDADIIISEERD